MSLAQETYRKAYKACGAFDSRWVVPEIKRNNLWYKAFYNRKTLPQMVFEILSEASQEEGTDCMVFPVARKQWPFFGKEEYAYRIVAYAMKGWPPKDGRKEVVRHLCNNEYCVHPDHLQVGTPHENRLDEIKIQAGKLGATDATLNPRELEREKPTIYKRALFYFAEVQDPPVRTPSGRKPRRKS
jgi:hypothetical protein